MLGLGGTRQRTLLSGAAALLLLVPAVPALAPAVDEAPWLAWRVDTVDPASISLSSTGIAVDQNTAAHIAFSRDGDVWYAVATPLGWTSIQVDEEGTSPDIALSSLGAQHVVYTKRADRFEVHYATLLDGSWHTEQVDPLGVTGARIAIGPDDAIHIIYQKSDGPDDEVRYAVKHPGDETWTTETIQSKDVFTMDIGVDTTGTPQVVYNTLGGPPDTIRYAKRAPDGTWQIEILDHCRGGVGIDTDLLNRPHVVCESKGGLQYHHKTDGEWSREIVSDGSNILPNRNPEDTGLEPSIAVDSQLNPHIAFTLRPNVFFPDDPTRRGELHYATKVDGEWFIEVADRDGYRNGIASSIDLDGNDRPHISYVLGWRFSRGSCGDIQNTCFDLRYATPLVGSVAGAVGR